MLGWILGGPKRMHCAPCMYGRYCTYYFSLVSCLHTATLTWAMFIQPSMVLFWRKVIKRFTSSSLNRSGAGSGATGNLPEKSQLRGSQIRTDLPSQVSMFTVAQPSLHDDPLKERVYLYCCWFVKAAGREIISRFLLPEMLWQSKWLL